MAFVLSFVWFGWAFDYMGCSSASSTGVLVAASWVIASWLLNQPCVHMCLLAMIPWHPNLLDLVPTGVILQST